MDDFLARFAVLKGGSRKTILREGASEIVLPFLGISLSIFLKITVVDGIGAKSCRKFQTNAFNTSHKKVFFNLLEIGNGRQPSLS